MVIGRRPRIPAALVGPARLAAPAVAILLDRRLGEPSLDPHPVAVFGSTMAAVEERLWSDVRHRGAVHTAIGLGLGMSVGLVLRSSLLATYLAVAGRALDDAAAEVAAALDAGDLELARERLPALVGRDPRGLDESDIARAVVESIAENTVDAVVSPVLWAVVGGAPGALGYRAVNTLDAMVGHRSPRHERYGWASARLDDLANHVPARVAAILVALVRPSRATAVARVVRRDAGAHPSPSGGVIESAFAAALDRRLGGPVRYGERREDRPVLGDGPPAGPADIGAARRLARDVDLALAGVLGAGALLLLVRRPLRRGAQR